MAIALPNPLWTVPREVSAGDTALGRIAFAGLCAFVFVMPWEDAVPLWGGFVISRWIAIVTAAVLLLSVAATRQFRRLSALHAWMLAFVGWAALTLFWTVDADSTVTRVGTYTQLLLAVWMIWELATTDERVVGLLKAYLLGASVMAASTIFNFLTGTQAADLYAEEGKLKWHDNRYTMLGVNENDMGLMLALSLPIAIYLLVRRRTAATALLCCVHLGLTLTALFLTGSRGGLISTAVGLTLFLLLYSRLARWQRTGFFAMCLVGLAYGIHLVPPDVLDRLRSTGTEVEQGTLTHRTVLWNAGLEVFRDHPFTGVGAGAYGPAIVKAVDIPLVAHSTYLSVLVEMGVPGFLLFAALIVGLFYSASRFDYVDRCFWTILLLTWATGVAALTWEYHKPTWFLFGLLIARVYSRDRTEPAP